MTQAWHEAVRRGSIVALERLLAGGADIDARDRHGQTALMLAAAAGDARVVAWLAGHGADLDHTAKFGLTALMLAVVRGHAGVVRVLVGAGASLDPKATGAPGFAGQTARDLARARADREVLDALGPEGPVVPRRSEPAFTIIASWTDAAALVTFVPRVPQPEPPGPVRLRLHVRDHRGRAFGEAERTLEAQYPQFVLSQSRHAHHQAQRLAFGRTYGRGGYAIVVGGRPGRAFPRGPEPEPGDFDRPSPAVVTWADGALFLLLASDELTPEDLAAVGARLVPLSS